MDPCLDILVSPLEHRYEAPAKQGHILQILLKKVGAHTGSSCGNPFKKVEAVAAVPKMVLYEYRALGTDAVHESQECMQPKWSRPHSPPKTCGCFCKFGVHFLGMVHVRALDFWKLPYPERARNASWGCQRPIVTRTGPKF